MTDRQSMILAFIELYWEQNWTSPAVREIGKAVGLSSPSSVSLHLNSLVRDGYLERKELPGGRTVGPRVLYRPVHV